MANVETTSPTGARLLLVAGQVQGVGFRPFVFRLAASLGLTGSVYNDPAGVTIRLFGPPDKLDEFERRLTSDRPPLARIDSVTRRPLLPDGAAPDSFAIIQSQQHGATGDTVTVDSATCPECLRELFDPDNRRFRHPLINCTNCGPRYSIVRDLPYDRPLTTMASFPMCPRCEAEYRDAADRRFHAQPTCCHSCGPRLSLLDARGTSLVGDPTRGAANLLRHGGLLAMKGLGGYHLVADARNAAAVARLRRGKRRDHKPFAIMAPTLQVAESLVVLSDDARAILSGPIAPIILAPRRPGAVVAPAVAPGLHRLGVMLPHTPMQHLLFREGLGPLVMTSANYADDPLITDDHEARLRLAGIVDAWLTHDRPIQRALDDSILLDSPDGLLPIRRARALVPTPLPLPVAAPSPGLCVGGELKATVAVVTGETAVLSQHLGDLNHTLAYKRFLTTIDDLLRLYDSQPRWIACDAHPAYLSHRFALSLARKRAIPVIQVQHHHAHLASLLAEHGLSEPIVGLVCDGVGYGDDGTSWGGEVMVGDLLSCRRVARLRPLRLPGGDSAAKQTGRCALSWLSDALGPEAISGPMAARIIRDDKERQAIGALLRTGLNCPPSSGLGRLFDAAASILGLCEYNHYEAMSGMRLEALADQAQSADHPDGLLPLGPVGALAELDHRPLLVRLVRGVERGESADRLARLFHEAVAAGLVHAAAQVAHEHGIGRVGLSGGVFCNALLVQLVRDGLRPLGLETLTHRIVPPNDGGLALGQAAVAASRLAHSPQGVHPCA